MRTYHIWYRSNFHSIIFDIYLAADIWRKLFNANFLKSHRLKGQLAQHVTLAHIFLIRY